MCMSTPSVPKPGPPPQEVKQPDTIAQRKKVRPAAGAGTLLTGPSGVASTSMNTGGSTLLGG